MRQQSRHSYLSSRQALNREIGEQIKRARNRAGADQKTLAKAIGYASANAIYMMEIGAKMIRATDLVRIANFLNCTVRSLFPKGSVR